MDRCVADDAELTADLAGALARGEIFAVYQPQFALSTRDVVGAEALCRWAHPIHGAVPPDVFIPLAEESGDIHAIGRFMLEEGLDALSSWNRPGNPMDVSVNVSPVQFEEEQFLPQLREVVARDPSPARGLTLEITESRPLGDTPAVVAVLDAARDLGVSVSLDDYGTGHASPSQLRQLPLDEVKLDRSLLDGRNLEASEIIRAVVAEARRQRLRIVAEGVETPEQLQFVTDIGCERAQGFLLGRPMERARLEELIGV